MEFTADDIQILFHAFDRDHNGAIDYNEFLRVIRGELNSIRLDLVVRAFHKLDIDGSGVVDYSDIKDVYNADKHPLVIQGVKTKEQILGEFLETFE
jgi:Ca2+-binding EF-hand superfamily protein